MGTSGAGITRLKSVMSLQLNEKVMYVYGVLNSSLPKNTFLAWKDGISLYYACKDEIKRSIITNDFQLQKNKTNLNFCHCKILFCNHK